MDTNYRKTYYLHYYEPHRRPDDSQLRNQNHAGDQGAASGPDQIGGERAGGGGVITAFQMQGNGKLKSAG